jgi:hypothetical protein
MPARKMRVELFDGEGNRYSISFEGQITRDKALRLIDLVELLGGVPAGGGNPGTTPSPPTFESTKFGRMRTMIVKHFPLIWFSSREVQAAFEEEYREPIALSTVATYLSRMAAKGLALRAGPSNSLKYKVATNVTHAAPEQHIP